MPRGVKNIPTEATTGTSQPSPSKAHSKAAKKSAKKAGPKKGKWGGLRKKKEEVEKTGQVAGHWNEFRFPIKGIRIEGNEMIISL